jgi:UDP-N-acetyl-D-galactosamine dehydrogenase
MSDSSSIAVDDEIAWREHPSATAAAGERGFAIIGLGYVGLPVALGFARHFSPVYGFDIAIERVVELRDGRDRTGSFDAGALSGGSLTLTHDAAALGAASFFVVAVPTPIDSSRRPDLAALEEACRIVGTALRPGAVVVFESTVYPGLTREICRPLLAAASGLRPGIDFTVAYSPERINPGDERHRLEAVVKIVAAEDAATLDRVAAAYGKIVPAGIYRAASIEIAEAAKVIENTQRDLNIALMNEFAIILDRMDLNTAEVLAAARTKWNFMPFTPGLVGGHCVGVDPYYLTAKAEELGYHPQVILAGRRINDGMGRFVAQRLVKLMAGAGRPIRGARVGILGLAFKENVADARNSRVPDIAAELEEFGVSVLIHDPLIDGAAAARDYGITLTDFAGLRRLDGLILAVPHRLFLDRGPARLLRGLASGAVFIDVKSAFRPQDVPGNLVYWSL